MPNPILSLSPDEPSRPAQLARWLFAVAALVFLMVVVGGITRITESGLSITEWKPLTGAIPPLSEAAWLAEFHKYQQIPEYRELNFGMTLAAFKHIYFWEWFHRLLGRIVGLAFFLPYLWFLVRRAVPRGFHWRLLAILALGGLQGAIGWWMVTSGLSVRTDVSHYRLAIHLLMALFIMSCLIWTALDLSVLAKDRSAKPALFTSRAFIIGLIVLVQILYGAWMAGLNAGNASYSWPLMGGHFFPENIDWRGLATFADDPFLVHFIHRWWAWVVVAALVWLARLDRRAGNRFASVSIHTAFGTQIILGIATVLTHINPVLAGLHQAVGASIVAATAWGAHVIGRR